MKTKAELLEIFATARELNMTSVEVDGVKYDLNTVKQEPVQELTAEQIVNPMSVFDEMSDEEIQYWSSPYYDEIMANKERQLTLTAEEKANESVS
jgi:hypothetical protein